MDGRPAVPHGAGSAAGTIGVKHALTLTRTDLATTLAPRELDRIGAIAAAAGANADDQKYSGLLVPHLGGSERVLRYPLCASVACSSEITFRNKHSRNSGIFPLETCRHGCRLVLTQRSNIPPRSLLIELGPFPTRGGSYSA
jgi:hypothetical protein